MRSIVLFIFMLFCIKANTQDIYHYDYGGVRVFQEKRLFQKVSIGITSGGFLEKEFNQEVRSIGEDYSFLLNGGFTSPYGVHEVFYNFISHSLGLSSRFFLDNKRKWNLTATYEEEVFSNRSRFAWGVEYAIPIKKKFLGKFEWEINPFIECGTLMPEEKGFIALGALFRKNYLFYSRFKDLD